MLLFAGHVLAADNQMTIAVFTKNRTNPAYEAFRIASDQIARSTGAKVIHFVPNQPDNVDEQKAMVEQVLKDRPDAVIFIPVDDVAMIDSVKKLNDAIKGYIHDDGTRKGILDASGRPDDSSIKDAVNLNNLDDWQTFYSAELR